MIDSEAPGPASAAPDLPALKQGLAKRIAYRLARWKWFCYTDASDETGRCVLNLSLAAAGYLPREAVDEALASLPIPLWDPSYAQVMTYTRDMAKGEEMRLDTPRVNCNYHRCDEVNYRASPHLEWLVAMDMKQQKLQTTRDNFDSLSDREKASPLTELVAPAPVPVPVPAPTPSAGSDVVSIVSAAVEALNIPPGNHEILFKEIC